MESAIGPMALRLNGGRGDKEWYHNGLLHRTDGPAVEWVNGNKEWYLNGVAFTEKEFNKKIRDLHRHHLASQTKTMRKFATFDQQIEDLENDFSSLFPRGMNPRTHVDTQLEKLTQEIVDKITEHLIIQDNQVKDIEGWAALKSWIANKIRLAHKIDTQSG